MSDVTIKMCQELMHGTGHCQLQDGHKGEHAFNEGPLRFTQSDLTSAEARATLVALEAAVSMLRERQQIEERLFETSDTQSMRDHHGCVSQSYGMAAYRVQMLANSPELVAAKQKMVEEAVASRDQIITQQNAERLAINEENARNYRSLELRLAEAVNDLSAKLKQARLDGEKAGAAAQRVNLDNWDSRISRLASAMRVIDNEELHRANVSYVRTIIGEVWAALSAAVNGTAGSSPQPDSSVEL